MSTKSKQSEAKAAQGYTTAVRNCGNCALLTSKRVLPRWMEETNSKLFARLSGPAYTPETNGVEKNFRCGIGGFAIKKTATCAKYEPKNAGEKA